MAAHWAPLSSREEQCIQFGVHIFGVGALAQREEPHDHRPSNVDLWQRYQYR